MLRRTRIIAASIFFLLLTLLFLDFSGLLHRWFGWLARIQVVPAVLGVSVGALVFLAVLTLLFGRVYCSVICPLGIMQDGISYVAGRFKKKNRFSYSPARNKLRYAMLVLFIAGIATMSVLAISVFVVTVFDPYAAYGRIASELLAPLYRLGNNGLAWMAERADGYAFYSVEVGIKAAVTITIAAVTLLAVGILSWRNGRTYCNTVCPVGTFLGIFSRFSLFKPVIDPEKCTKCSLCARNCKASCIDYKHYTIDHSRCVACMNCLGKCRFDALHFTGKRPEAAASTRSDGTVRENGPEPRAVLPAGTSVESVPGETAAVQGENGMSRRGFLTVAGAFAAASLVKVQAKVGDGGLAVIVDKKRPDRKTPVTPPGSLGVRNLKGHCSACQLCVSACPNDILIPSGKMETFMQPEVTYEKGYCRPECTRCSEVCPSGAIRKITPAEKSAIQIGRAVWIRENCVVLRDRVSCRSCERHCPAGAIQLVRLDPADTDALLIPAIDTDRCIGCGACEHYCPARPYSAIYVEGNLRHHTV